MDKMNKKQKYELLASIVAGNHVATDEESELLGEFIDNEISLLDRKASSTANKTNKKREECIELIRDVLGEQPIDSDGMSVSQMMKDERVLATDVTAQRLTNTLTYMCVHSSDGTKVDPGEGDVIRTVVKGTPFFKLA